MGLDCFGVGLPLVALGVGLSTPLSAGFSSVSGLSVVLRASGLAALAGEPGGVRVSERAPRREERTAATSLLKSTTPELEAAPDNSCSSLV